jgi:FixJ family two-component response regulator
VLFDVRLPGPEWERILHSVQGLCPGVPVVLICAAGTGSAVGAGVVGVLHEPLRSDRIVAAVNAALRVG